MHCNFYLFLSSVTLSDARLKDLSAIQDARLLDFDKDTSEKKQRFVAEIVIREKEEKEEKIYISSVLRLRVGDLIAYVLLASVSTELALDSAAPYEFALALLGNVTHARLISTTAAQEPATVQSERRSIAYSSSRAGNSKSVGGKEKKKRELLNASNRFVGCNRRSCRLFGTYLRNTHMLLPYKRTTHDRNFITIFFLS